ncbi:ABC transporter six-transmembrane domain-containing protein [Luteimonas fraxinea]|uniref:ABC transporter six-transmembrane domain-containing protein n=1 Tax=Luteimonas fraxinea TaxID=2901869 RepID=UPI002284FC35|nr:ABC transporter six-transmembrane domain-containing protein [Luteimonas fraxinea]
MIIPFVRRHRIRLVVAYATSTAGSVAGQLYPIATALAINGVLEGRYWAVLWLLVCHFSALVLEVAAKMLDTRVFTRLYADMASDLVIRSHEEGVDPSLIAARTSLSREYVTFLERDVPAVILAIVSLGVSLSALFWLDPVLASSCLLLFLPLYVINRWLAVRSLSLNAGLNDRLEHEVRLVRAGGARQVRRHFTALSGWRVRISDAEAKAFGAMELTVIILFAVALWRLSETGNERPGDIYAIFAYLWKFVLALDQVPQLVQQLAKLKDLNGRLARKIAVGEAR